MKKHILVIVFLSVLLLASCSHQKSVDEMTDAEKEVAMQKEMERNPPEEMTSEERVVEQQKAAAMETANVLKSGDFTGKAHPTSGSVKLVEEGGKLMAIFSDDFKSDAGPRLHVFLTEHSNPQSSKDLHTGAYYDLGVLKSTKGTQIYDVPEGMADKFNTAVIYCKPFKVIFGTASLS